MAAPNENGGTVMNPMNEMGPTSLIPAPEAAPLMPAERATIVELAPPAVLTASPTPLALLVALKRRWLLALILGVIAAVPGALAAWYFLPTNYRARTLLQIAANDPYIIFPNANQKTDFVNYQRSQVVLVKSRLVLNAALRDPEIASLATVREKIDPCEWLEKKLQVEFPGGVEIMTIYMLGERPKELTKIVNAIRDAYIKEIVTREHDQRRSRLDQLQKIYSKYDEWLRVKTKEVKRLQDDLALGAKGKVLESQQKYYFSHLEDLQREQFQYESEIRKVQVGYRDAEAKVQQLKDRKVPADLVEQKVELHADIVSLKKLVEEKTRRVEGYQRMLHKPESDVSFLFEKNALASAKEALEARRKELKEVTLKEIADESRIRTENAKLSHKERLDQLETLRADLEQRIAKKTQEVHTINRGSTDLEWLDEDLNYTRDVYRKLGSQKEALQVEIDAPSRVTVLEQAYAVATRDESTRIATAGLSGFGAFGLAVLCVSFLEFRARRVSGFGEVSYGLGLRIVGVLPQVPLKALAHRPKKSADNWHHLLTESIASTRTMLIHAARTEGLRVVMVSSALKGEGKTLVSSHLAVSMALAGFKTLLIDADLRCPAVYRLFDLPHGPGLSELLRGQARLKKVLHPGKVPGLTVMTAGKWDNSLLPILAQQRVGEVIAGLKNSYDFIIVDSAPILTTSDTALMAQHTDGVLLSVLCEVSRLPMVHLAYERLGLLGVRTLGAVVGGVSMDAYGYGYGYGNTNANQSQ